MIFYVYLDPEVISAAEEAGEYGRQSLIALLRGFLQNCFIAEFDDESVQTAIREKVDNLPESFDRKKIMALLGSLKKNLHFIYSLKPDYSYEKSSLQLVKEQAQEALIDLVLVGSERDKDEIGVSTATELLSSYQRSNFETNRSELARNGITLVPEELDQTVLLDNYFKKALRYARSVDICDRMFGRKYGADYEYTMKVLLRWLGENLSEPERCRITFHCEEPDEQSRSLDSMKRDLSGCKTQGLKDVTMRLNLYESPHSSMHLPHDRFIITDQIAIGIPRGMGFLNPGTRKNRDLTLDYKNKGDVERLLNSYVVEAQFDL
jgi:hypothetical protein